MKCAFNLSALLLMSLAFAVGDAADPEPAWPQANGPFGNFSPRRYHVDTISDFSTAKQVWVSDDDDLGYAKGSASGYASNLARWEGHPGSSSGPILADGLLFVTSFRPSGEPVAENLPHLAKLATTKKPLTKEDRKHLKDNLRILADDLTVAIDIDTGKTVWKAIEEGRGLNRYMGKRQGFCVSPAYSQGKVFSMGTTGLLYAYEAKTGKKLWETNIGATHQAALSHRDQVLAKKILPGGMGWDISLVVANGVLIVPLFDGVDVSLRGVNVESGKTLWETAKLCSRHATPAVWKHEDHEYLLTATVSGSMHMLNPKTGQTLWTVEGLGPNHMSLVHNQEMVFANGGSSVPRRPGSTERYGLLAAYKLSTSGAKLAWKHPQEPKFYFGTWMDSCARRFLAADGARLYYRAHSVDRSQATLMVLESHTGNVLAHAPHNSPAPHFYPVENRLLMIRDASHSETELSFFQVSRSAGEQQLTELAEPWHPPHQNTTAYEVFMEHPIADGRIYLRTKDGRVACYDFRKP